MARRATSRPEKKLLEFQRVLAEQLVLDRDEKILVFTEHRDTLTYLTEKLKEWGHRVCSIHGGMKLQDRIAAEKEFGQLRSLWSLPTPPGRASTFSSVG